MELNERRQKIKEGLKLLVEGILEEASVFADDVRGIEGFERAPTCLTDEARRILDLTKGPYYKSLFSEVELKDLELKYRLVYGKVSEVASLK